MAATRHHDQNFKNLILDCSQDAIAFFAPAESQYTAEPGVRIVPVRGEQLKENRRNSHRELDTPLLAVYASATRGLNELESDPDKHLKYLDFIDIYAALDENESNEYQRQYPAETVIMSSLSQRLIAQGEAKP